MTERAFFLSGLKTGDPILLALRNGGAMPVAWQSPDGGWGVPDVPVDPEDPDPPVHEASAEIVILKRNPALFAPDGVVFRVTNLQGFDTPAVHAPTNNLYQPQFHDIDVFWEFGDEGSVYSAPVNVLPEWKNRNVARGHDAAHVYREPGTYTVTAFLVEMSSGKTATATLTVTVLDADDVFPGNLTYYINSAEDYTNAPAGAVTAPSIESVWGTLPNACRIMLASGHEETLAGRKQITTQVGRFICAEPGAEVRPLLWQRVDGPSFESWSNSPAGSYRIFQGIETRGYWNPVTETGVQYVNGSELNFLNILGRDAPHNLGYHLLDDIKTRGLCKTISASGGSGTYPIDTIITHDNDVADWGNFGYYIGGVNVAAALGNRAVQNPEALAGGPKDYNHNMHGPYRWQSGNVHIIDGCDHFGANGWSMAGPYQAPQGGVRLNSYPLAADVPCRITVSRIAFESGYTLIGMNDTNDNILPMDYTHNLVVQSAILMSGWSTDAFIQDKIGGGTYRDLLAILPDVPAAGGAPIGVLYLRGRHAEGSAGLNAPSRIYNVTLVSLLSPANATNRNPGGVMPLVHFQGQIPYSEANNLLHRPNSIPTTLDFAPIDDTPLFTPRTLGYKDTNNTGGEMWTQYATPADSVWSGQPLAGSAAIDAATGPLRSASDLRGLYIEGRDDVGAWEADG